MELHRTFELPEHPGLTEMKKLECLARKRPCQWDAEQWAAWQAKEDEREDET